MSDSESDNDQYFEGERTGRKSLRTTDKLFSIAKKTVRPLKRFAKVVSWNGSRKRVNKCIRRGRHSAVCVTAETANQLVRKGSQAIGVLSVTASTPLMAAPTGITQIGGVALATSGVSVIYNADDYGNAVAEFVEGAADKVSEMTEFVPSTDPDHTWIVLNPHLHVPRPLTPRNVMFQLRKPVLDLSRDDGINRLSHQIRRLQNDMEIVPVEKVDTKGLLNRFHHNFFDGAGGDGYMRGVKQYRADPKPHIEVIPRLPDVISITKDETKFMIPLGTVPI